MADVGGGSRCSVGGPDPDAAPPVAAQPRSRGSHASGRHRARARRASSCSSRSIGPFVAPYSSTNFVTIPFAQPSTANLLGGDILGRDVLSRVLDGGWELLLMALCRDGLRRHRRRHRRHLGRLPSRQGRRDHHADRRRDPRLPPARLRPAARVDHRAEGLAHRPRRRHQPRSAGGPRAPLRDARHLRA